MGYASRLTWHSSRTTRGVSLGRAHMNVVGLVDSVGRDLRHSARALWRRPAFAFAAMLTLALGIGATTAIFSVVYSVLIKPLPYPNADELLDISPAAPGVNVVDLTSDPTMYLTYR